MLKQYRSKNKIQIKDLKRKSFNKVSYKGKKNFVITNRLFKQLLTNILRLSQLQRRTIRRRIYKKYNRVKLNRRFFFGREKRKKMIFIKYFFFCFSFAYINTKSYGKMLFSHLEILRRKFRQNLDKNILIELYLKPYKILLKRPSQIRMGSGKASKFWKIIYPIYPGLIILKIFGGGFLKIKKLFSEVCIKIPFKLNCAFLSRL